MITRRNLANVYSGSLSDDIQPSLSRRSKLSKKVKSDVQEAPEMVPSISKTRKRKEAQPHQHPAPDPDNPEFPPVSKPVAKKSKSNPRAPQIAAMQPPEGWRTVYQLMQALRRERDAPVDWAGSEKLGVDPLTGQMNPLHALVALMLSSQTKDQVVADAMARLRAHPAGLSVEGLLAMPEGELNACIGKVGFHNNKTKFLRAAAAMIRERHGGAVPDTLEGLCALPGVGPKMAHIALRVAFGKVEGIGVDTHMHRILNHLAWVNSSTPEQTRRQLEAWLPREDWPDVNVLLVGLGQMTQQPLERRKLLTRCLALPQAAEGLALLARLGADLSGPLDSGEPALASAVREGRAEVVAALVRLGAARGAAGKAAAALAAAAGREDLARLIRLAPAS